MSAARSIGAVGTLVWDRIEPHGGVGGDFEGWGGISYGIAALSAALPDGWVIRPIVKVGEDMAEEALALLRAIPRVDASRVVPVARATNRVELRYRSRARRAERLTGGVGGWSWEELRSAVEGCDALYVNFISGFEMTLSTCRLLSARFPGPMYADLHSLFLGIAADGRRIPRAPAAWRAWADCFDAVQMNEEELALLAEGADAWAVAERVVGTRAKLVAVTRGARGASCVWSAGARAHPLAWKRGDGSRTAAPQGAAAGGAGGAGGAGRLRAPTEPRSGDPTGCGDVWGATAFARLLAGDGLEAATREANRLGALNVGYRGASGLAEYLAGIPARGHPRTDDGSAGPGTAAAGPAGAALAAGGHPASEGP